MRMTSAPNEANHLVAPAPANWPVKSHIRKEDKASDKDEDGEVIHKGISKRYFKRSFTIANDVKVKGAELKDGLLKVSMEKIIPEEKKLKTIDVK